MSNFIDVWALLLLVVLALGMWLLAYLASREKK